MIGALCYAELGTMITKSGGEYQYLKSSFGSCLGIVFSWANLLLSNPIGTASIAAVFGRYVLEMAYFDINDPSGENMYMPEYATKLTTIGCIWAVVLFNCYGRKAGAWVSNFFTVTKLIALFMIIIIGFVWLGKGSTDNFQNSFEGASTDPLSYGTAMYMALFSYNGWNNLNYGISEVKNPKRNLPLAIIISCVSVTIIYILANIAYFATLSYDTIATSSTVAMQLGLTAMGKGGAYFFALMVVFSTFGAVNANIWAGSRLVMTAANEDSVFIPAFFGKTNEKTGAPMRALIFVGFTTTIWSLPGDFTYLATIYSFLCWLFYGITVSGLIYMRFKKSTKDMERPFKIWLPFAFFFVILDVYLVVAPLIDAGADGVVIYVVCILIGLLSIPIWFVRVHKPEVGRKLFGWIRGYDDARMVKLQRE
jgi:L-type amino acid transporter 9